MRTISLEELNAVASLQTRVDRKYALHADAARGILETLPEGTRVLEVAGATAPRYASMYFDTPDLASFRMAAHSRRRRFKLRTRAYVDSRVAFLEVKTRGARSVTVKDRLDYDIRDRDVLTDDGKTYAEPVLADLAVDPDALGPTLRTRYRRTTYLLPGGSRATVDTALEWEDAHGTVLNRPHLVIVETKSTGAASELDRLLWRAGHRPASLSKYGTGLAALRPALPANKWTRVLRRHFHAA
jgi:SPX domain-containing protein involved in vacuolar polyphosphate accumulation